jgi:hypothetical protein
MAAAGMAQRMPEEGASPADSDLATFRVQVRSLFVRDSFAELDALASQLRTGKLRFKGGTWRLNIFYTALATPGAVATDEQWQARIEKLERWIKSDPASPTPRVALAQAYLNFADKARGAGYSNTVTPEGWALFRERIQQARAALEAAAQISGRDPEWYHAMQVVAIQQGWDQSHMEALTAEAAKVEPTYYPPYSLVQAMYLLPIWHGHPGDTERYVEQAADQTGGAAGDAEYCVVAVLLNCCGATKAPGMRWARVRQGFEAVDQLYGSTSHLWNMMAFVALRAGDPQFAQQMFERIGNDWDVDVWRAKALFDASRTGKTMGSAQPLKADWTDAGGVN